MSEKNTILIVDDKDVNRKCLIKLLEDDYDILEACDGEEAIKILDKKKEVISAVVLDIIMPKLDGYGVLHEMSYRKMLPKIPVIVTSVDGDEESELKALSLGASDFLGKPYNPIIVKKRLENIIHLKETASLVNYLQMDTLTGVYSKETFAKKVKEVLKNNKQKKYAILYSDIENFQLLKDLFGEKTGDNLLVFMAKVLKHYVSKDEICGRIENEHFVILKEYDKKSLHSDIDTIVRTINDFPVNMNLRLRFGIYLVDNTKMSMHAMINRAILAVDTIRGRYGRYIAYYDKKIWEKQVHEQEILNCMEDAIKEEQFKVYFQPKYDLNSEKVAGAEALVRWIHPEKGFMNPGGFIPLFETNGFITELDKFVWDKTCEYIQGWKEKGYPVVPVSVNVSRTDIYNPDFMDIIMGIIKKHGLEPENIHLEITETAYTENPHQIIEVVKKLKLLGFVIEMDDFGSGYSSLNMLNELPIDILKLDMGFVQGDLSMNSNNILSFIISLAKWMDYAVVAEGIETEEQIQMLRNMDCNFVQGYYYAKPMPPEEFERHLIEHSILNNDMEGLEMNFSDTEFRKSPGVMLIVDDLVLNRKILSASFSKYFKTVEKENGAEALEYIKEHADEIDVIMLDLVMPVMDGFTLMKQLRMEKKYSHIPIIVTSQSNDKSVEKSFALGATDFVEKPYNPKIIMHRVQNVVMAYKNAREEAVKQKQDSVS
ncbi:EAL domain-containing protein [Eubacterium sp. MSJ-13]|uniref:EAL domain-containing protein n=1 Tax=Eubacterium sp. MSJ-13 TaxID=2841513 RepID=UPI001C10EF30|nr:EAL domain-containing protein [Eubacterium sp. MSJ-13]MBU5479491.1 EAL domain-containing protein [Eubacterium sp. MSJ-13]